MKFFVDTAKIEDIKKANEMGVICGVTTNPSLIAKEGGRSQEDVLKEIASIVDGPISGEVKATTVDAEGMIAEGREIAKLHPNMVVKIPMTIEGLKATKVLASEGIKTNVTLIFSANQALLAARAGATYVSPFLGRLDDISQPGIDLIRDIAEIFSIHGIETEIIAASVRNPIHVTDCALAGADIATVPYGVIEQMTKHPLTTQGIEKFQKENDAYRDAELVASEIWTKYVPLFEFLSNMLTLILMLVGGIMVIRENMTLGNFVTINGYLWMLTNPLRQIGWRINDIQRFTTSVEKIYATYSEEPLVKHPKAGIKRQRLHGDVTFRNVSYRADDEDIIQDISFDVKSGQTVGILGSTGSGKSTIMNLLCRFYDVTDGEVLVDGINVKNLDLYHLRENIGMAMQDVFLFSDTIEGNIAYSRPDCPFDEVKKAAIMADANHFIQEMPDGYDTIVGERGVGLSGGQKQRISLARALLKEPSILILDDTTSAVDMETESYIQKQLQTLGHSCTIFIVAYRISSIKDADLILVLNEGRIVEQGTHDELLKNNGYYATVFRHQYGEYEQYIKEGDEHGSK